MERGAKCWKIAKDGVTVLQTFLRIGENTYLLQDATEEEISDGEYDQEIAFYDYYL